MRLTFREWVWVLFPMLTILCLFLMVIVALNRTVQSYQCAARWEGTYKSNYSYVGGCRVFVKDMWYPENSVRTEE